MVEQCFKDMHEECLDIQLILWFRSVILVMHSKGYRNHLLLSSITLPLLTIRENIYVSLGLDKIQRQLKLKMIVSRGQIDWYPLPAMFSGVNQTKMFSAGNYLR